MRFVVSIINDFSGRDPSSIHALAINRYLTDHNAISKQFICTAHPIPSLLLKAEDTKQYIRSIIDYFLPSNEIQSRASASSSRENDYNDVIKSFQEALAHRDNIWFMWSSLPETP